jgi:predicted metal-dependent hydrolase
MAGSLHHDSVRFGNTEIAYTIGRSKNRSTIGITVCGPLVEVTAPSGMRAAMIRPYIEKKGAWILQKLDLARHHAPIYPSQLQPGISIRLLGRQHQLRIISSDIKRPRLENTGRQFRLQLPPGSAAETGQRLIRKFLRERLESILPALIQRYSSILKIAVPPFQVQELGNRWGSCSPKGNIRFHWMLATQDLEFIQQVAAQELCHLIEPLHSSEFRKLLASTFPR